MAPVQQGIGSIFKALAQAPVLEQQMREQAALRNAQTYHANMTGNKAGAEAAREEYTLGQRQGVDSMIAADPSMEPFRKYQLLAYKFAGPGKMNDFANAGTEFQTQDIRGQAVANVDDLDKMNRLNTLAKPGATYEPLANIGNTGTVFNKATGDASVASSVLEKWFGNESRSKAAENYASAERSKAATEFLRTRSANAQTTSGKPLTAAQLRANAEIEAAREALAGMSEPDITALLSKDSFSLTPGDKNTLGLLKKARSAKYGENAIPEVSPQPAPPPAPKPPSLPSRLVNWLIGSSSSNAAPAKSAAGDAAPVKVMSKAQMDALPSGTRFIAPDGSIRIKP